MSVTNAEDNRITRGLGLCASDRGPESDWESFMWLRGHRVCTPLSQTQGQVPGLVWVISVTLTRSCDALDWLSSSMNLTDTTWQDRLKSTELNYLRMFLASSWPEPKTLLLVVVSIWAGNSVLFWGQDGEWIKYYQCHDYMTPSASPRSQRIWSVHCHLGSHSVVHWYILSVMTLRRFIKKAQHLHGWI